MLFDAKTLILLHQLNFYSNYYVSGCKGLFFYPVFYRVKNRSDSVALQNATPFEKWGNAQTKSQQIAYFCIKTN